MRTGIEQPATSELQDNTLGRIITFYSFKGGTGRSMALANLASMLGRQKPSGRVLLMDWDLEAPGLQRYFPGESSRTHIPGGVINYFFDLREHLEASPDLAEALAQGEDWRLLDATLPLSHYVMKGVRSGVDLMPAGPLASDGRYEKLYATRVQGFDWIAFHQRFGAAVDSFRRLLMTRYDYVLVDSRTGLTDISGICTMLLPEKLVAVFTPNEQSLYGLLDVVEAALEYRRASNDFRPLAVFPLPSRIEVDEHQLRIEWRSRYQDEFESLFTRLYGLELCDLTPYFDQVMLPHRSYFAYGERIAVDEERPDALSLRRAYEDFFRQLLSTDFAWEVTGAQALTLQPASDAHTYDVYLSYNSDDAAAAASLAGHLRGEGLRVFLDRTDVIVGQNWQMAVTEAIHASRSVAVLIGSSGLSSQQNNDLGVALEREVTLIPVLLPGSSDAALIPPALRVRSFARFKDDFDNPEDLRRLIWGIRGARPVPTPPAPARSGLLAQPEYTSAEQLRHHASAVVRGLARRRVIPVLGWGMSLIGRPENEAWGPASTFPPTRTEFAHYLAYRYDYPGERSGDLESIAEYVQAVTDVHTVHDEIREAFGRGIEPSLAHRFFAALPGRLRERGYERYERGYGKAPLILVSFSYDDLLEKAFKDAGEPHHVLAYRSKFRKPDLPSFCLVTENGDTTEMPPSFLRHVEGSIIVKLHGSIWVSADIASLIVTVDDHIRSLLTQHSEMHEDIPRQIMGAQRLYLGFGVTDWGSRVDLARLTDADFPLLADSSWVVSGRLHRLDELFWTRRHIQPIQVDLSAYFEVLEAAMVQLAER